MSITGTYDSTIYSNPATKYCVIRIRTADRNIPEKARDRRRYSDHLIRFTAVGYDLPCTDAVELEFDGEWTDGKYGLQLQVGQWQTVVPRTEDGVKGYLGSGLIKGIGEKTAAEIVARFGVNALDILEKHPERLLEVRGITENKLEDIKTSFAESRALRDIMTLLVPFKLTPATAQRIYQHFGPASVKILKENPFELCQISGFGFLRVDAIVQNTDKRLNTPMRIKGALYYALDKARAEKGHLFLPKDTLVCEALKLLNKRIPVPELRVQKAEVEGALEGIILGGSAVSMKDNIYSVGQFTLEDETARQIALRLLSRPAQEDITGQLEDIKARLGISLSARQETATRTAFCHNMSIITGPPGTGKTTVLRSILEVYKLLHPDRRIVLMAPTGRASRRMAESTGFEGACTMHSGLGLLGGESEGDSLIKERFLDADLVIVDEFSMVDMWLARQFFGRLKVGARIVMVGDPDQLPSVGAGNVFKELIQCGLIPVTVLDEIFRQASDSRIAHNAKLINAGNTELYYGEDFMVVDSRTQEQAAEVLMDLYCKEVEENGIERVQILSPYREEGETSVDSLNGNLRERLNPFRSEEEEIRLGGRLFRAGDRIMQTKNTKKVSNGDLGFVRYIRETPEGKRIGMDFGEGRQMEYAPEDMANVALAYATTIHKAMGSEYDVVLLPLVAAQKFMLYRNLLYTGITRAKKKVILVGQKGLLYMAINRNGNIRRNTLLGERIGLYYKAYARSAGDAVPQFVEEKLKNAG